MKISLVVSSIVLCTSSLAAQQSLQPQPMSTVKDLGVYHLASGTWTHGNGQNLGAKVLYQNNASTGFFGTTGQAGKIIWTDEGRIPGTGGHGNAKADNYVVQSIEIVYCTQSGPLAHLLGLTFYECYASCTEPSGLTPIADFQGIAVPGSSALGTTACWIVTFDLKGTTDEFNISGDCDETFDGTTGLDNFGWTFALEVTGGLGGLIGPGLCGDPNNVPYGDGTYYQNAGATYGSGLGTQDQMWINDVTGTFANGCYWFGGYSAGNPFASFWITLGGDNEGDDGQGTKYCATTANSTGAPADISASAGTAAGGDITLTSAPVPNQPSIFFHGPNQANVAFGNGVRCVGGQLVRGAVTVAAANSASYTYDGSDNKHDLTGFVGGLRHFQHWFRDPMAGGAAFNLSNGVMFTVQ